MCTQQIGKLGIPFQHPHYKAKLTEVKIINKLVENKPRDQLIEANNILKDEKKFSVAIMVISTITMTETNELAYMSHRLAILEVLGHRINNIVHAG